eukprot:gene5770-biopygen4684
MDQVEKTKRKRTTTRGLVTKLIKEVEELLDEENTNIDSRKLTMYQGYLEDKSRCLKKYDEVILDSLFDEDADEEICANKAEEADEIRQKIAFNLICFEKALKDRRGLKVGLTLSDKDYDAAVDILERRYAKPMQIKRAHINNIINLAPVFNDRSLTRLRNLHDDLEAHFRGLEAMGAEQETYSSVVVPVVMEKIPESIRHTTELEIRDIHVPLKMNGQQQVTSQNNQRPRQNEKMGTASALFMRKQEKKRCPFCLQDHEAEACERYKNPEDHDLVASCRNTEEAYDLYTTTKTRMQEGGFKLRKWKTNSSSLAKKLVEENEAISKEVVQEEDSKSKILGLPWDKKEDVLEFDLEKVAENTGPADVTKRGILSSLATIFDPLGVIGPVAVPAKILFQDLCLEKKGWDDPIPADKSKVWQKWIKSMKQANTITTPRAALNPVKGKVLQTSLHGFEDASKKAYCAAIYLVYETTDGIYSGLLCSKSRIAPLKCLSIRRLELMAAKILTTLMQTVTQALSSDTKIDEVRYWSDVLYWIQNKGEWKTFVRHRANEILKASRKDQWGHAVGTENPADIGSRGPLAEQLKEYQLWWEGPFWLKENRDKWPSIFLVDESNDVIEERKKSVATVMVAVETKNGISEIMDITRFSSLKKLFRVTAYVRRFIHNLKQKVAKKDFDRTKLRVEEIKEAEREWIVGAQFFLQDNKDFAKYKDQLGIVNKDGILICKGRFEYADLEFDARNPIILPKNHEFTDLVIMDCHVKVHHCRVSATIAELRSRYWITQGRQYVKRLLQKCFTCKKLDGKSFNDPAVAQLPDFRVNEAPPFSKVGVDFAGAPGQGGVGKDGRQCEEMLAQGIGKKLIHFWNRWKREYLVSLREQHRMNKKPSNAIGKGDMVLMQDDNKKRIEWKLDL